jgi:hypothetical protein
MLQYLLITLILVPALHGAAETTKLTAPPTRTEQSIAHILPAALWNIVDQYAPTYTAFPPITSTVQKVDKQFIADFPAYYHESHLSPDGRLSAVFCKQGTSGTTQSKLIISNTVMPIRPHANIDGTYNMDRYTPNAWSPHATKYAYRPHTAVADNDVAIIDIPSGSLKGVFRDIEDECFGFSGSNDDLLTTVGIPRYIVSTYDLASPNPSRPTSARALSAKEANALQRDKRWSPRGNLVASSNWSINSPTISVHDFTAATVRTIKPHFPFMFRTEWSPDGQQLAITSTNDVQTALQIYDYSSGTMIAPATLLPKVENQYLNGLFWVSNELIALRRITTTTGTTLEHKAIDLYHKNGALLIAGLLPLTTDKDPRKTHGRVTYSAQDGHTLRRIVDNSFTNPTAHTMSSVRIAQRPLFVILQALEAFYSRPQTIDLHSFCAQFTPPTAPGKKRPR